jgi:hypothetical protein
MSKKDLRQFDYRKVAKLDSAMWRAYYNHQFFKMFILLLKLFRTQLHLGWFSTTRLAYYSAWAAADYRLKKGRENYERTFKNLVKFYRVISKNATKPFDFQKAAELELEWWDIHRYPKKYKKTLEESLAEGMAAIYNIKPADLHEYASYRAEAMHLPGHEGDKQEDPVNWNKIDKLLVKSWRYAHQAIQK